MLFGFGSVRNDTKVYKRVYPSPLQALNQTELLLPDEEINLKM
jgi:hypothetical protein